MSFNTSIGFSILLLTCWYVYRAWTSWCQGWVEDAGDIVDALLRRSDIRNDLRVPQLLMVAEALLNAAHEHLRLGRMFLAAHSGRASLIQSRRVLNILNNLTRTQSPPLSAAPVVPAATHIRRSTTRHRNDRTHLSLVATHPESPSQT